MSARPATAATPSPAEARLHALSLDGRGPVWMQIRRALAAPILEGAWPPGTTIPGELSIAGRLGLSRMTVAKAVQSLAGEGLVERKRRVGTVVAARAGERPVFEIWDIADVVKRSGGVYAYRLLSCDFVHEGGEQRSLLGVARTVALLQMACLHMRDGAPFQFEERLVNVDAAPGVTCQPLETTGPGPWLLAHVAWTRAEHVISACPADPATAARLDVATGTACLVVERRTWNGSVPVTYVRLWHPGSQHRLVGGFEP